MNVETHEVYPADLHTPQNALHETDTYFSPDHTQQQVLSEFL